MNFISPESDLEIGPNAGNRTNPVPELERGTTIFKNVSIVQGLRESQRSAHSLSFGAERWDSHKPSNFEIMWLRYFFVLLRETIFQFFNFSYFASFSRQKLEFSKFSFQIGIMKWKLCF